MAPFFRTSNLVGFVTSSATRSQLLVKTPSFTHGLSSPISNIPKLQYACLRATSPVVTVLQKSGLSVEAIISMILLALQFGLQPSLTRKFTPKKINKSTVVFTQDIAKFCMAASALFITGGWSEAIVGWNYKTWLTVAGVPAILYCIQNFATLTAYQNLSPLTFNVLNQSKTLSAALCCYLLMGKVQSPMQIISLLILFTSACVIEKILPIRFWKSSKDVDLDDESSKLVSDGNDKGTSAKSDSQEDNHTRGLIAVLLASFISGLAGEFYLSFQFKHYTKITLCINKNNKWPISMMRFVSLRKDKPGFCPCARTKYFLTLFHNSNCVSTRLKVI